ncbi:Uncharacterized protein GBIM_03693 [Gryllus bimaculatus]|nr:Uncharacterized protein GBIM_03693 [Gryllus bimaculatus]
MTPPMTTHASVVLNASLTYPAITKYNMVDVTKTSHWEHFPYDEVTLQEFWDEATFNTSEVLISTALHELPDIVKMFKMKC